MRIIILLAAALAAIPLAAQADDRVGYVNLRRVLAESDAGKQSTADLRAWAAPRIAEAEKAPAAKRPELNQKLNAEFQERDAAAVEAIRARVAPIAEKLRAEQKLNVVVEGSPLAARFDLTAAVVKRLNAETPKSPPVASADALKAENAALRAELAAKSAPPLKPPASAAVASGPPKPGAAKAGKS